MGFPRPRSARAPRRRGLARARCTARSASGRPAAAADAAPPSRPADRPGGGARPRTRSGRTAPPARPGPGCRPCAKRRFGTASRAAILAPYARLGRLRSTARTSASGRRSAVWIGCWPVPAPATSTGRRRRPVRLGLAGAEDAEAVDQRLGAVEPGRAPARVRVLLVHRLDRLRGQVVDRRDGRAGARRGHAPRAAPAPARASTPTKAGLQRSSGTAASRSAPGSRPSRPYSAASSRRSSAATRIGVGVREQVGSVVRHRVEALGLVVLDLPGVLGQERGTGQGAEEGPWQSEGVAGRRGRRHRRSVARRSAVSTQLQARHADARLRGSAASTGRLREQRGRQRDPGRRTGPPVQGRRQQGRNAGAGHR